jgi:hypothetical protein
MAASAAKHMQLGLLCNMIVWLQENNIDKAMEPNYDDNKQILNLIVEKGSEFNQLQNY